METFSRLLGILVVASQNTLAGTLLFSRTQILYDTMSRQRKDSSWKRRREGGRSRYFQVPSNEGYERKRCYITSQNQSGTSRKQWRRTHSRRYISDMAWSCPSERGKTSRCDRSSCRPAGTRTSTHGRAMSHQTRHRLPRVAGLAFPCPSREVPRSLAPRVDRGRHWLGCSGQPHSRCCLSIHDPGRTVAGRWSECLAPLVTINA